MEVKNALYRNQGIHAIASIFTVEKGITKILLIKRNNEPFKGKWALVGGALYNNENLDDCIKREIKEKTGIEDIDLYLSNVHGRVDRSPIMRMVAISYVGIIDSDKVKVLNKTLKTTDADWFAIDSIPALAYDHNEILPSSLEKLKSLILNTNILRSLFPNGFTLPEIQQAYESILDTKFDRRNFRRKFLSLGLIIDTNKTIKFNGTKPAKLYKFKNKIDKDRNVF